MCGRFGQAYPRMSLKDWYRAAAMPEFDPRYNIASTTNIVVIRDGEEGRAAAHLLITRLNLGHDISLYRNFKINVKKTTTAECSKRR